MGSIGILSSVVGRGGSIRPGRGGPDPALVIAGVVVAVMRSDPYRTGGLRAATRATAGSTCSRPSPPHSAG